MTSPDSEPKRQSGRTSVQPLVRNAVNVAQSQQGRSRLLATWLAYFVPSFFTAFFFFFFFFIAMAAIL
jgi:hypothetical protein